ncbi:hypothetical protein KEM56_007094 [Ascosphaera pollenicola]|nr:hypothetical protein KEM56_007094 [Ascosphaera pollenicola]
MASVPIDLRIQRGDEYSDFTIECETKKFPVHRVIVCNQSSVIAAAMKSEFKERINNSFEIKAFDAETVDRMVDAMYYVPLPMDTVTIHCKIAEIANYFDLRPLQEIATSRIAEYWTAHWDATIFIASIQSAVEAGTFAVLADGFLPSVTANIAKLIGIEDFTKLDLPSKFLMAALMATTCKNEQEQTSARDSIEKANLTARTRQTEIDSLTTAISKFRLKTAGTCRGCSRGQHAELNYDSIYSTLSLSCTICRKWIDPR